MGKVCVTAVFVDATKSRPTLVPRARFVGLVA